MFSLYASESVFSLQALEMFYKGGNYSFYAILPDEVDGLEELVKSLQDPAIFYELYNSTTYEKVRVNLPKYEIESEFNLGDIMQKVKKNIIK